MGRLVLESQGRTCGWLEVSLMPLPDDDENIAVKISVFSSHHAEETHIEFTTEGWQVGEVYFEVLGWAFVRAEKFAQTRFPISYYSARKSTPGCTLHIDVEYLQVFIRGMSNRRLAVDCFLLDEASGKYMRLEGNCSFSDAKHFGEDVLRELEVIKTEEAS